MTEFDFHRWANEFRRAPAPIIPLPALHVAAADPTALRGKRVVVGLPGHGWRTDLRADSLIRQDARSLVPVLPEADWYRAEQDRVEVFAPLIPAERVWVETLGEDIAEPDPADAVSMDRPPVRPAVHAEGVPFLTGRRLAVMTERADDYVAERDVRAVTEAHRGLSAPQVRIATEGDWYRWASTGLVPPTRIVPLSLVWLE